MLQTAFKTLNLKTKHPENLSVFQLARALGIPIIHEAELLQKNDRRPKAGFYLLPSLLGVLLSIG